MDGWVVQVAQVLARAHDLFADPALGPTNPATNSATTLAAAGTQVRTNAAAVDGLSGNLVTRYSSFAAAAGPALDTLAARDTALGTQLEDAATSDRQGRLTSGTVLNAAAGDTTALAPTTTTPAGQRALIQALRDRVSQQSQVVSAYQLRDARLAALIRQMMYASAGMGSAPTSSSGFPQMGSAPSPSGSGLSLPSFPSSLLSGLTDTTRTDTNTVAGPGGDEVVRAAVPTAAAGRAVEAALSRRGTPYVWGAEGPNSFDCSGLTEWAWRQAGVQLGDDTYSQVSQGVPVAPGDVQAGDLIFPRDSWDSRGPGHVQLAISPTQVVHAPSAGDVVRVANMPSSFVARRPVVGP